MVKKGKPAPKRNKKPIKPVAKQRTPKQARNQRAAIGALMGPQGPLGGGV